MNLFRVDNLSTMSSIRLPGYSDRQNRALPRIIEIMAAEESRAESRYKSRRRHHRRRFQGAVQVCQPTAAFPAPSGTHPTVFAAWAYNLSATGIGFVAPLPLADKSVAIGLRLPDGNVRWMPGRIVRSRQVPQEEFFDYGVEFDGPKTEQATEA
jgi:hypothetical protein